MTACDEAGWSAFVLRFEVSGTVVDVSVVVVGSVVASAGGWPIVEDV